MTLGDKIKKIRNDNGWTQSYLSKKLNIHIRLLGKYELDQVKPTSDVIVKLSKALNVTTDYLLLNDIEEMKPTEYIKKKRLLELFSDIEKLNEKDQDSIISVLDAFIAKNKK